MRYGNITQEKKDAIKKTIQELEDKGYRIINLENKSPDLIAIKGKKVYAVAVLGKHYRPGAGWHKSWTKNEKYESYHMFDDIIFREFEHIKKNNQQYHKNSTWRSRNAKAKSTNS